MIRIPISAEAFEAMARTLPLGSAGYENEINERGSSGRPSASAIGTRFDAQSRPIFYSLPRRRCYARHGVDRLASRHAGLHSRFHVPSCSMEVQPCPCHLRPVIRLRH
jgi:hypothetical protein